jgi:sec-independent protein translocase protein TatA
MFGLGTSEIVVILLIVLIIFGGSRLPQLGKGLGEAMKNFRDAFKDGTRDDARRSGSEAEFQRGRDNSTHAQRDEAKSSVEKPRGDQDKRS